MRGASWASFRSFAIYANLITCTDWVLWVGRTCCGRRSRVDAAVARAATSPKALLHATYCKEPGYVTQTDSCVYPLAPAAMRRNHNMGNRPSSTLRKLNLLAWTPLLGLALIASPAIAQPGEFDQALATAKTAFRPVTADQLASMKTQVATNLDTLQAHLQTMPAEQADAFRQSLKIEALGAALEADATNLPALRASLAALSENQPGLENEAFLQLRDALRRYERALVIQGNAKSAELYQNQIDSLGGDLKTYSATPTPESALQIGSVIGNLELAGQAPGLVKSVRERFRQPNLRAHISEKLAAAGIDQAIDRTQAINEVILGTVTNGTAELTGATKLDLKPNSEMAEMEIALNGVALSNNVGVNRGVTIYSQGHTTLNGGAVVTLGEDGAITHPAWATAATGTTVTGLWHRSCLVRKIAWRQVGQQKANAEQVASQRAANRLAGELNAEADETVSKLNENYLDKFRYPLLRKGEFPSRLDLRTSDDALSLVMTQAGPFQLAAPTAFPESADAMDLAVQVHQSFVGNMSQGLIGGETLTSDKLAETLKEVSGEVPEGLASEDEPPWSITFSRITPVQVAFEDNLIRISIRGRRFTRGDEVVQSEMVIATAYKIERTDSGVKLVRQGDVTAEYTKGGFQNPQKIAIKTVMRKKFSALFKEERMLDGLQLPGRWESVGKLQVQQLDCGNQWLSLGWTMPPAAPQNVTESSEPTAAEASDAVAVAEE